MTPLHVVDWHVVQCHYLSVLIRFHVMHPNTLVSSIVFVSNLLFHCNNCHANTAFVTILESTAPCQVVVYLMQNLRLRGRPRQSFFRG